jgi:hypothetical protein
MPAFAAARRFAEELTEFLLSRRSVEPAGKGRYRLRKYKF